MFTPPTQTSTVKRGILRRRFHATYVPTMQVPEGQSYLDGYGTIEKKKRVRFSGLADPTPTPSPTPTRDPRERGGPRTVSLRTVGLRTTEARTPEHDIALRASERELAYKKAIQRLKALAEEEEWMKKPVLQVPVQPPVYQRPPIIIDTPMSFTEWLGLQYGQFLRIAGVLAAVVLTYFNNAMTAVQTACHDAITAVQTGYNNTTTAVQTAYRTGSIYSFGSLVMNFFIWALLSLQRQYFERFHDPIGRFLGRKEVDECLTEIAEFFGERLMVCFLLLLCVVPFCVIYGAKAVIWVCLYVLRKLGYREEAGAVVVVDDGCNGMSKYYTDREGWSWRQRLRLISLR